jgi:hypothetical protein
MQAIVDGMSSEWQRERAVSQMTLGKLIERLSAMPQEALVDGIKEPHSYRGYYVDLAFEPSGGDRVSAGALLQLCRRCMGDVFEGYKGGDFQMGKNTPVWIAMYGRCGDKVIALRDDGTFEVRGDE